MLSAYDEAAETTCKQYTAVTAIIVAFWVDIFDVSVHEL